MASVLLAIDQGTTGTTSLVVEVGENDPGSAGDAPHGEARGTSARTLGRGYAEFAQHFPQPGWVSHDVREIWASVEASASEALAQAGLGGDAVAAIGITNQRETTVVWDRQSREPIDLAIVWQCRRTSPVCDELKKDPAVVARVRQKTGLVIDAYFSATKIAWLLDHVSDARRRAERGELAFGTIDCFLIDRLTGGSVHATDVTNASRTLLMDLERGEWDPELARLFRVPTPVLPAIVGNAGIVGRTRGVSFLPDGIPIAGIAGDQQAALFGQACFSEGDAKCTYGTGAFALMNIGEKPILSEHGLVTTAAWRIGGKTIYALEGSAFIAGAAVQWLRDGLGLVRNAKDVEALARSVDSSEGVIFVPALSGLGAPYWDPEARGTITGITRGTTAAHLARATLEGIAYQVNDLLVAMARDARRNISRLRVDGGAAANDLLMQFQADVANVVVERPSDVESTARGAAMLAAIGAGLYRGTEEVAGLSPISSRFAPSTPAAHREQRLSQWSRAVERTRSAR